MKSLIITHKGCEEAVKKELDVVFGIKDSEIIDYAVKFEVKDYETLMKICYRSQSAAKVLILLDKFEFKTLEDIQERIKKVKLSEFFEKDTTFASRAVVFNNDLNKQELESEVGTVIDYKVNLNDPDIQLYTLVNKNKCYFGIDFAGMNLSMREYKVFTGREDLKGTVAFSLLMLADYVKEEKVLDPYTRNGVIAIEASLFSLHLPINFYQKDKFIFRRFPKLKSFDFESFFAKIDEEILKEGVNVYGYDPQLKNIKAAQMNAKIAGVLKKINLTKTDVEWLDTKFKEKEINKIVSLLPVLGKFSDKRKLEKEYDEFFYQSNYVLADDGIMVVISNTEEFINKFTEKHKFKIEKKTQIWQGNLVLDVYIIKRI